MAVFVDLSAVAVGILGKISAVRRFVFADLSAVRICLLPLWQISRIMAQSAFTIRLDSDLKMQFDSLCEEFGMSANTAFNIYVRQVVRSRRIPFLIEAPAKDDVMAKGRAAFYAMRQAAAEAGIQDMSLDEINEEIRLAREGR